MKYIIRHGHVVDPANDINSVKSVFIDKGVIVSVGRAPKGFSEVKPGKLIEINARGKTVLPGIVDTCARLREPGEEHKATIQSETRAAVSGGITTLVCPPDTYPPIDTPAMVNMIRDRARAAKFAKVAPLGALTVGLQGDKLSNMAMLMDAGCVGVSNALNGVDNTLLLRRALQYAATYSAPVFMTPHDRWLLGNGSVHEGEVSTRLGLPAIPEAAETVGVARDIALIETTGVSAHFDLISSARSVKMVAEARRRKLSVSAGVSINHLLLDENAIGEFNTLCKTYPPLRTVEDRHQLVAGLRQGVISVICSDHKPHGRDSKLAPFPEAASGISSLDTLLTLAWRLVRQKSIDAKTIVAALTINPAKTINIDAGHLSPGAVADVCIFDQDAQWILQADNMLSRGKNSPFLGENMMGKVTHTFVEGKLVYQN